jgi:riboflavin synthase
MFTGIIQDIGKVEFLSALTNSLRLGISTKLSKEHLALGASMACNGCCLTVVDTKFDDKNKENIFYVDVGPETLAITCFSELKIGSFLNLEPALRVGDAMSGHQVTGHIDTSCEIYDFKSSENGFWKLSLLVKKEFAKWVIPKGSICVAGISLTVANRIVRDDGDILVEIMIIPHTYCYTILQFIDSSVPLRQKIEVEFDHLIKAIASTIENMVPMYI